MVAARPLRVAAQQEAVVVAVTNPPSEKHHAENRNTSFVMTAYRRLTHRPTPRNNTLKPAAAVSASLQALTAAALALPGLMPSPAHAADEEASFLYGYYAESNRNLYDVQSRFDPITVNSFLGSTKFKLADRVKFTANFTEDIWSGATPIATAPLSFGGNREGGVIAGATPYLQNDTVYFNKQLNPLRTDPSTRRPIQNPLTGKPVVETELVHTISAASPEVRNQGDFKLSYEWDEAALDAGGGLSVENDYNSHWGNLAGRMDFNQKQTSVNLGLSYTNSETNAILDHNATPYIWETSAGYRTFDNTAHNYQLTKEGGNTFLTGNRQDWATNLGITQVLNQNALIEAGLGYTRSTGYMGNPYKTVETAFIAPGQTGDIITGSAIGLLEERPDQRNQLTQNVRYIQHINGLDAALHFDYRFFHDDWGINAHTFEADWIQPLGKGWTFTPRIRYYSQDAADFYTPYIVTLQTPTRAVDANGNTIGKKIDTNLLPANYSSDHRLSGFGAISGGLTLSKQFARGVTFETGIDYYTHEGSLKLGGGG